jgi:hypothetical protein
MNKMRGLRRWAARLFGRDRWVETVLSALGIAGGIVTAGDIYTRAAEWLTKEPMQQLRWYLWATLGTTWVILPMSLVLYRAVHRDLWREEANVEVRERAIKLQHLMAEIVRRCAELRQNFKCQEGLHVVGSETVDLLRMRLGGERYSITVKQADLRTNKLEAIFRDSLQDEDRRVWDSIKLSESVVYERFREETAHARKTVLIRDTERLPSSEIKYRERAKSCGYRTVVAFPLRDPLILPIKDGRSPDAIKCANLIGFLSIDAPEPDAFAGLFQDFHRPKGGPPQREDGEDLAPRGDIDFFYGLADAIATILVLQRGHPHG